MSFVCKAQFLFFFLLLGASLYGGPLYYIERYDLTNTLSYQTTSDAWLGFKDGEPGSVHYLFLNTVYSYDWVNLYGFETNPYQLGPWIYTDCCRHFTATSVTSLLIFEPIPYTDPPGPSILSSSTSDTYTANQYGARVAEILPEPATWLLVFAALVGLGALNRIRRPICSPSSDSAVTSTRP